MSSISTIKDVAARAGVAPSTVSKYINGGSVREKNVIAIREAIAELEFRANPFARNLKSQRSHAIGVLLPDLSAPFFSAMLEALNRVIRAAAITASSHVTALTTGWKGTICAFFWRPA